MSTDQVMAFFDKLRSDEGLKEEAKGIRAGADREVILAALMKMAKEHGFSFDEAALETGWEAWKKKMAESGELSDEALERVAGGSTCQYGV
jgi:predicted ribosomally synthesized peptide with nif11-like leader